MRRVIHRLRFSAYSAICSLPASTVSLLHQMSTLYVDTDSQSGESYENGTNENMWQNQREVAKAARQI